MLSLRCTVFVCGTEFSFRVQDVRVRRLGFLFNFSGAGFGFDVFYTEGFSDVVLTSRTTCQCDLEDPVIRSGPHT